MGRLFYPRMRTGALLSMDGKLCEARRRESANFSDLIRSTVKRGPAMQGTHQLFIAVDFKQVHALPAPQALRRLAFFEPGGDDEDLALGHQARFFQSNPHFLLAIASLPVESLRETYDDHIA